MNSAVSVESTGSSPSAPTKPDVTMTGDNTGGALHGPGGAQQRQQRQSLTASGSATVGASSSSNTVSTATSGNPTVERPVVPTSIAAEASLTG